MKVNRACHCHCERCGPAQFHDCRLPACRIIDPDIDIVEHLYRQRRFSEKTFGPGQRTAGLVDHITKELEEIIHEPEDITEWIDIVILAFDGAWRAGYTPEEIVAALVAKQIENEGRKWPDWRTADKGKAIEHVREKP